MGNTTGFSQRGWQRGRPVTVTIDASEGGRGDEWKRMTHCIGATWGGARSSLNVLLLQSIVGTQP